MNRILLLDIGNTHTHVGLANSNLVVKQMDVPTTAWLAKRDRGMGAFLAESCLEGASICSVVPAATPLVRNFVEKQLRIPCLELTHRNVVGIGIDYPKPSTIGSDRLANAMAAVARFGAPCVVVDFGTAVTFDVVDRHRNYVGGIIAPGLSAMTTYLHEKTALLPAIEIKEIRAVIGKSTTEAMLIGAVHGYRGLVKELLAELRSALSAKKLPVIFTGGYAKLIAKGLRFPAAQTIAAVDPALTLEGLRLLLVHFSLTVVP